MFKNIVNVLAKTSDTLNIISKILLGIIVISMVSIVVLQVFLRYVLNSGFSWPEEATTFLMAWMTFIGSAIAIKQLEHINIQMFVNLLPSRIRFIVKLISNLVLLSFLALFTYVGYGFAVGSLSYSANTLNISLFWPRVSLVVGGVLMIFHLIVIILKDIKEGVET